MNINLFTICRSVAHSDGCINHFINDRYYISRNECGDIEPRIFDSRTHMPVAECRCFKPCYNQFGMFRGVILRPIPAVDYDFIRPREAYKVYDTEVHRCGELRHIISEDHGYYISEYPRGVYRDIHDYDDETIIVSAKYMPLFDDKGALCTLHKFKGSV